jgi:iron complex outermembrane receptor protein
MARGSKWLGCAALMAASAMGSPLLAAPAVAQAQTQAFEIPSQPLSSALLIFSRQSGEMVVASPTVTQGKQSREVRGTLPPQEAISRMLIGSGLEARVNPNGGFLIELSHRQSGFQQIRAERASVVRLGQPVPTPEPRESADTQAGGLSEIVVTAQRREQNVLDVPVAVSAIGADSLAQNQIADVSSLQRLAPSLTVAPFGDATTPLLSIRGQVAQDIVASVDPAVGVYVDGVYLGRATGANLAFLDVERVEVLRGPQGTLFGRNTIGGAISITPMHPTDKFEGRVTARYGNYDAFGLTGIFNAPLADGVAVRVAASHSQRDGFARSSVTGAELNSENLEYVRASLKAELGGGWDVLVSGDFSDSRNSGQWITLINTYPVSDTLAGIVTGGTQTATQYIDRFTRRPAVDTSGPFTSRSWGVSGILSGMFGAVNVKSITAYREVKRGLDNFDQDGTPFDLLQILYNDSRQHQFSQEVQFYGKMLDDRLDWIVGGYYFTETGRDTVINEFLYPLNPNIGVTDARAINKNLAFYGQLTFNLTDELSIFGGIRYARDTRRLDLFSRTARPTPDVVVSCGVAAASLPDCFFPLPKKTFEYAPFSIGVNYKPSRDVLVYAKWSRGFRSGGYNSRGSSLDTLLPFDPERVDSYEIGGKLEIDRRFRINAAVYQSDFDKMQLLADAGVSGAAVVAINQNAGSSRIRGLELEAEAALGQLRLNGALTLTDAKFKKLLPNVVNLVLASPIPYTPKTTVSIGGDYAIPTGFGDVILHGDYNWRSRTYFMATPPLSPVHQQRSYGLLNASITANVGENISLSAFGKNLTNRNYFTRTTGIVQAGFDNAYPGDPRTYGVSASYRF